MIRWRRIIVIGLGIPAFFVVASHYMPTRAPVLADNSPKLWKLAPVAEKGGVRLGRSGASDVKVWRDQNAFREGIQLINAGVQNSNPTLISKLLRCQPDPGDRAVIVDRSGGSATVTVIDGDNAGCRGVVAIEDVRG